MGGILNPAWGVNKMRDALTAEKKTILVLHCNWPVFPEFESQEEESENKHEGFQGTGWPTIKRELGGTESCLSREEFGQEEAGGQSWNS